MKTVNFEYKAPPKCLMRGCYNTPEWFTDLPDREIGLCMKHYKELETEENLLKEKELRDN